MKKYIFIVTLLAFVFSESTTKSYKIDGMFCSNGCVNRVKNVMKSIDGVENCDVSFEKSLMTVEFDDSIVSSDFIASSVTEKTTYKTTLIENENDINDIKPKEKKSFWSRFKNMFKNKS